MQISFVRFFRYLPRCSFDQIRSMEKNTHSLTVNLCSMLIFLLVFYACSYCLLRKYMKLYLCNRQALRLVWYEERFNWLLTNLFPQKNKQISGHHTGIALEEERFYFTVLSRCPRLFFASRVDQSYSSSGAVDLRSLFVRPPKHSRKKRRWYWRRSLNKTGFRLKLWSASG